VSNCIQKLPHSCGSRKGLQVFEKDDGTLDGFCFSCNTYVKHPYGEPKSIDDIPEKERLGKSKEEIREEIEEIQTYPVMDLRDRMLREAYLDYYGIKIGLSEQDGKTPRLAYFPYYVDGELQAYKCKLFEGKRFWSLGDQGDVDLFGWQQAIKTGSRRLIIVEGEFDAPALKRIIDLYTEDRFEDLKPAVCSLPHGAASAGKDLARLSKKIRKHFKEITFCFDGDEAGELATQEAMKVFPEATVATLPMKDANECLLEGKKVQKAAYKAVWWDHTKTKNTRLVCLDDIWEDCKEAPEFGVSWPWKTTTDLTRGIRKGETIYIGAAQKMGKSEVVNALAGHLVVEHDWKILLAKPEEANKKTGKLLAGKIAKAKFHDPSVEFDEEAFEEAGKKILGRKVYMLDLYQHADYETFKADCVEAAANGVDAIFLDPITNLTNGMSAADANTKLQEIAQDLAAMAKDLDVAIFIFCHLRNPEGGPGHDRGGKVLTSQFAGSRAMGRSCNYMFGLEGNKDPELSPEDRNTRKLVLLDDREFGEVGETNLYWNPETTVFAEM